LQGRSAALRTLCTFTRPEGPLNIRSVQVIILAVYVMVYYDDDDSLTVFIEFSELILHQTTAFTAFVDYWIVHRIL